MKDNHGLEYNLPLTTGIYTLKNALFSPLAISLHLMKGFISPYQPCLPTTLNPLLAPHIPNHQAYRGLSQRSRSCRGKLGQKGKIPALRVGWWGTQSSIPPGIQLYFVVPLTVCLENLIPPYCIPDAAHCPVRCFQSHWSRKIQTPTWYKFSNMNWRKENFFLYTPAVPSRQQQLVQTAHFAACVSVQKPRHRLLAAAVAVMKLVHNKHEVMKQWKHHTIVQPNWMPFGPSCTSLRSVNFSH